MLDTVKSRVNGLDLAALGEVVQAIEADPGQALAVFDTFFRVGALVFGGGHVVLPLLYAEVVPTGWVTSDQFVAGYGAAQAVPGPLFTFAAYLGAVMQTPPNGLAGAALALVAVFLPSFLLVIGALPYWDALRGRASVLSTTASIVRTSASGSSGSIPCTAALTPGTSRSGSPCVRATNVMTGIEICVCWTYTVGRTSPSSDASLMSPTTPTISYTRRSGGPRKTLRRLPSGFSPSK